MLPFITVPGYGGLRIELESVDFDNLRSLEEIARLIRDSAPAAAAG